MVSHGACVRFERPKATTHNSADGFLQRLIAAVAAKSWG